MKLSPGIGKANRQAGHPQPLPRINFEKSEEEQTMKKEDIKRLEAILGDREFPGKIVNILSSIEHDYHSVKKWRITRPADEKKEHKEIKKAAEKMLDILKTNPELVKILIETDNRMTPGSRNLSFQSFVCCHEALVKGCDWFLANVRVDKGGRPDENMALRFLINGLAYAYANVTEKRPALTWDPYNEEYSGKFFKFVEECLNIIDSPAYWSNNALGEQIKRTLKSLPKETSFYSLQ